MHPMTSNLRPLRALGVVVGLGLMSPACVDAGGGTRARSDASTIDGTQAEVLDDGSATDVGDARDLPDAVPWPAETCVASGTTQHLWPYGDVATLAVPLGDMDGDGTDDTLAIDGDFDDVARGRFVRGPGFRIALGDTWFVTAMAADMNADGRLDLVLGVPWDAKVHVFLGPIAGDLTGQDAAMSFSAPATIGGLSTWFGRGLVIADHNGDGHVDLIVTAPSYGEVACLGELAPTLFLGPFAEGDHDRDAEGVSLDAVTAFRRTANLTCVGHYAWCSNDGVALAAPNGKDGRLDEATWGCVALPAPIVSSTPTRCAAWPDDTRDGD